MSDLEKELGRLQKRTERERAARQEAERLLEHKSRELYEANQRLQEWSSTLEERVLHRTEELEQQTRELQVLVSDRERFTAALTHELRTPLQGILGFANLGISRGDKASYVKIEKWFNAIHRSGETLLTLVNNLLDVAKFDAGMMEIAPIDFSAEDLYNDAYNEFTLRCKDKNVSFKLEGDGDISLHADQFRIGQVFRNLIGNALKFCDKSSEITLSFSDTTATTEIRVINKGPKIPDHEAEFIFQAFVESSSTAGFTGGTGLGLAICHQIMTAHNGRIWLDTSHPDTCFVVELPHPLQAAA